MTTIVGVKKNGRVAIAADTQTNYSSTILPGPNKSNPSKIVKIGSAFIGLVGSTANVRVVESLAVRHPKIFDLSSTASIFESLRQLQPILEREYFVQTSENDRNQEYDSNQLFGILISRGGLFAFHTYREVSEIECFWAAGSGMDYAIGAMDSVYDSKLDAKAIAERGVKCACKFDDGSGLPIISHSLRLNP